MARSTEHFWKFYSLRFKLKQKQICGDKAEGMFENDDLDYPSSTCFDGSSGAYPGGVQQRCSS
jgi:hypothetical protein